MSNASLISRTPPCLLRHHASSASVQVFCDCMEALTQELGFASGTEEHLEHTFEILGLDALSVPSGVLDAVCTGPDGASAGRRRALCVKPTAQSCPWPCMTGPPGIESPASRVQVSSSCPCCAFVARTSSMRRSERTWGCQSSAVVPSQALRIPGRDAWVAYRICCPQVAQVQSTGA